MEMQVTLRLSHYFEQNSVHCPCPVLAVNGFQTFVRRKEFLLFVILISFILLYATNISIWINESIHGHGLDQQPCDGGTGGQSGTGRVSGKPDKGGGSHDVPQASFSSGGDSSSSGDNGDDDPNKKPHFHKSREPKEIDSEEEESDDDIQAHSTVSGKGQMVANPLQPPARHTEIKGTTRDQGNTDMLQRQCSNFWTSSPYKSFEHSEHFSMCPLKEKVVIQDQSRVLHQPMTLIYESTNDEQQPQQLLQSAGSIGEEQLNLDLISVASTDNEGILEQLPFYTTIPIESFSGPHSASHLGLDVSAESIQSLHANTYYELAYLQSVQEQVLQAAETTEPFDYTLAFVMYDHDGTQLLVPCLPDAEFDPAADVYVVAIPADSVLSHFTVHINPHLH